MLRSENRNTSKTAGLWESESAIQVRKLTIWVISFEKYLREEVEESHQEENLPPVPMG